MYILEIRLNQHVMFSKAHFVGTSLAAHSVLAQPTKAKTFHIWPLFHPSPHNNSAQYLKAHLLANPNSISLSIDLTSLSQRNTHAHSLALAPCGLVAVVVGHDAVPSESDERVSVTAGGCGLRRPWRRGGQDKGRSTAAPPRPARLL